MLLYIYKKVYSLLLSEQCLLNIYNCMWVHNITSVHIYIYIYIGINTYMYLYLKGNVVFMKHNTVINLL